MLFQCSNSEKKAKMQNTNEKKNVILFFLINPKHKKNVLFKRQHNTKHALIMLFSGKKGVPVNKLVV